METKGNLCSSRPLKIKKLETHRMIGLVLLILHPCCTTLNPNRNVFSNRPLNSFRFSSLIAYLPKSTLCLEKLMNI